jgi:FkbM family methyltransferase
METVRHSQPTQRNAMSMFTNIARILVRSADDAGLPIALPIRGGVARGLRLGLRNATRAHLQGSCEVPVQHCLERYLRPGDVFLDVGGNIGFFSLMAARLVGPEGRVYAVEPVPENVGCIRVNALLNRLTNVTVLPLAAGRAEGTATLMLAAHSGGATLSGDDIPPDLTGRIEVPVSTIDRLIETGAIRPPALVKIDVEGSEPAVLEGMERTLTQHRPKIVFEVDSAAPARAHARFDAVAGYLSRFGYHIDRLDPSYTGVDWTVLHGLALPER